MAVRVGRVTTSNYYFKDDGVVFMAGTTRFRVHRHFFERESGFFRDMFEEDPEAGTEASPLILDVKPDDFAQLLWVWYDRDYSYERQPKERWVVILGLAKLWRFDKIKELALRELEALELPPAERISIYDDHGINGERVVSSYVELCKSPKVPTKEDARFLQMKKLITLLQAREEAQRKAVELGHHSPTSASLEDEVLREIVAKSLSDSESLDSRPGGLFSTGSGDQAPDPENDEPVQRDAVENTTKLKMPQIPDRNGTQDRGQSSHTTSTPTRKEEKREKTKTGRQNPKSHTTGN